MHHKSVPSVDSASYAHVFASTFMLPDDELDQRLAALKRAKGETPYAESKKRAAAAPAAGPKAAAKAEGEPCV